MATKKPTAPASKKSAPASRKPSANNPGVRASISRKSWVMMLFILIIIPVSAFAYNKYLDLKNVQDMEALLSNFQQLEKDMEKDTGEEFTIEADCGSAGKFATSYACSIYLLKDSGSITVSQKEVLASLNSTLKLNCEHLPEGKLGAKNSILCTVSVRGGSESKAEQIFYDYDKSPGSPF